MTGKTHVAAGLLVGAITVDHYHTDLFSTVTLVLSSGIEHLRIHCYS